MVDVPRSPQRINAAEQRAKVVALRRQRLSFNEIGHELGVTKQRVYAIYKDALAEIPALQVEAHRAESLALIDDALNDLLLIARNHAHPRAVEAWGQIRMWEERKARLLGLDAETKVAVRGEVRYEIVGVNVEALK